MSDSPSTLPACCPAGSWPQLMTTSNADLNQENAPAPKGTLQSISVEGQETDLPLYVVKPSVPVKGIVLVLPDVFSVRALMPEVRSGDRIGAICDALAEQGYLVGLAGIFLDQPYDKAVLGPEDGDFLKFDVFAPDGGVAWIQSNSYDVMAPRLKAATAFLKETEPDQKIGVMGFCYGTWLMCKASSTGDISFDCGVGCHPTTILEKAVFGRDEEAMMDALKQPTTILWAGNDVDTYTGEGSNKKAIEKTGGKVHEFPDMQHGWVSRGCISDAAVKAGVETAMTNIKEFLETHMS